MILPFACQHETEKFASFDLCNQSSAPCNFPCLVMRRSYDQLRVEGDALRSIEEEERQLKQKTAAEREGFKSRMEMMQQARESLIRDVCSFIFHFLSFEFVSI